MSKVNEILSALHANFEATHVGDETLVELDSLSSKLSLEHVNSLLVGAEVEKTHLAVLLRFG